MNGCRLLFSNSFEWRDRAVHDFSSEVVCYTHLGLHPQLKGVSCKHRFISLRGSLCVRICNITFFYLIFIERMLGINYKYLVKKKTLSAFTFNFSLSFLNGFKMNVISTVLVYCKLLLYEEIK